jgi:hypothetical protein
MAEIAGGEDRGKVPSRSVIVHNLRAAFKGALRPRTLCEFWSGRERKQWAKPKREDTGQMI